jgi:hypothetical protein
MPRPMSPPPPAVTASGITEHREFAIRLRSPGVCGAFGGCWTMVAKFPRQWKRQRNENWQLLEKKPPPLLEGQRPWVPYSRAGKSYRFELISWSIPVKERSEAPEGHAPLGRRRAAVPRVQREEAQEGESSPRGDPPQQDRQTRPRREARPECGAARSANKR